MATYLLANFGGPRTPQEIFSFLQALLTDRDVTGGGIPSLLHKPLFSYIAKRRARHVAEQYAYLGGGSPIFQDTENLAKHLSEELQAPVIPFHRYLPETHERTLLALRETCDEIIGVPLFPHYTFAVTGSIIRFFLQHLPEKPIAWITQYGVHPNFISCMQDHIQKCLMAQNIAAEDCCFLFSVHGLPQRHIRLGDPYAQQCWESFNALKGRGENILSFQSKFGIGKWLGPSTQKICQSLCTQKRYVVIVPFGFVSDHIETLYEIDHLYVPILLQKGYRVVRVPAVNTSSQWVTSLAAIVRSSSQETTLEPLLMP
ncbi:ferrochelatase [Chlamydia sp.]|uniref:ferrochelatase n=1 Tax=Chlamydia sp. TaxID=35827 RepID=UPI0025BE60F0|nr:ferrochelatase [Chlamydia sp.]MBQ8498615.1 ferrochelatase [Chlamydia sp.]